MPSNLYQNFVLGLRPSIGHIIHEKIKIIIDQRTDEKPNKRAAYIAYQELFDELTSRYNRERSHVSSVKSDDSIDLLTLMPAPPTGAIFVARPPLPTAQWHDRVPAL